MRPRRVGRAARNIYSCGHIPFHLLLEAGQPCLQSLERYALAAAGETLRLHDPRDPHGLWSDEAEMWQMYRLFSRGS